MICECGVSMGILREDEVARARGSNYDIVTYSVTHMCRVCGRDKVSLKYKRDNDQGDQRDKY